MKEMQNRARQSSWVMPTSILSPIPPQYQAAGYPATSAAVGPDNKLSVRIDWDGDESNPGSFEIKTSDNNWFSCKNLDTGSGINDLIFPASVIEGDEMLLEFERAGAHAGRAFAVRAIAITWSAGITLPEQFDDQFAAKRGEHYQYRDVSLDDVWTHSNLASDGTQRVVLGLPAGVDYEIWVNIQHPSDDDKWMPHDPVVRTGSSQPGAE